MTKIKLPLRVFDVTPNSYWILDADDEEICMGFKDQKTAQLFADCFTAWTPSKDNEIALSQMYSVMRRAAEAVEG